MKNTTNDNTPKPRRIKLPDDAPWSELCYRTIQAHGGTATKRQLEDALRDHPKAEGRQFWRNYISRTVQTDKRLIRASRGVWALREQFSPRQQKRLDDLRAKECPLIGPFKKR